MTIISYYSHCLLTTKRDTLYHNVSLPCSKRSYVKFMKITAVTCMKNEGPFILEWVAYNRMIGVTDFLVYTNDCTDGTVELLNALAAAGIVTRLDNPAPNRRGRQWVALDACVDHPLVQTADWVYVSDVDEFMDIRVGQGRLVDLIEACGNPMAISVTFRMMANGGVHDYHDLPVISQFTKSHDPNILDGHKRIQFKTLTRKDFPVERYNAHRPFLGDTFDRAQGEITWTDGSGRPVPDGLPYMTHKYYDNNMDAAGCFDFAALNHYALRSLESYIVKSERGDVIWPWNSIEAEYWQKRNEDSVEETSILRRLPELRAEMDALKALPDVGRLHEACAKAHKAMAQRLLTDEKYKAIREELIAISPALR